MWKILKNIFKRKAVVSLSIILGLLILLYAAGAIYFQFHFYPDTQIDGVAVGNCTVRTATEQMDQQIQSYHLTVKGAETQDIIYADEIGYVYDYDSASYPGTESDSDQNIIQVYLNGQNQFMWPFYFLSSNESKIFNLYSSFSEDAVRALVPELTCMTTEPVVAQSAYLDYQDGAFVIVPETAGTELDENTLYETVVNALRQEDAVLDLSEIYIQPEMTSDYPALVAEMAHGNTVGAMTFTLNDGTRCISIPSETVQSLLTVSDNTVTVDQEKALEYASGLTDLNPDGTVCAENAHITYQEDTGYVIVPETPGTELTTEAFVQALVLAINEENPELDVTGLYQTAEITSDNETLNTIKDEANAILSTTLTIQNDYYSVTLAKADILSMVSVTDSGVEIDASAVKAWVNENEVSAFNHVGVSRNVTTAQGNVISLSGGTYGNRVDATKEAEQIVADLKAHEDKTRAPIYAYEEKGGSTENDGVGYTYLDVDISAQTVYLVQNGEVVYSTPMVSGNVTSGYVTPTGIYYVSWKTTDWHMKKYNVDVAYWMPIDDSTGVGLHDASWRSSFGGTIYQGNGSHGCINLPYDAAKYLYNNTSVGIPVIVH